jgi:hypothetical protein
MTTPARPLTIKSPEIKRRCKAALDAAEAHGLKVGGMRVEFNEQGMVVEVLDKQAIQTNDRGLSEWV